MLDQETRAANSVRLHTGMPLMQGNILWPVVERLYVLWICVGESASGPHTGVMRASSRVTSSDSIGYVSYMQRYRAGESHHTMTTKAATPVCSVNPPGNEGPGWVLRKWLCVPHRFFSLGSLFVDLCSLYIPYTYIFYYFGVLPLAPSHICPASPSRVLSPNRPAVMEASRQDVSTVVPKQQTTCRGIQRAGVQFASAPPPPTLTKQTCIFLCPADVNPIIGTGEGPSHLRSPPGIFCSTLLG